MERHWFRYLSVLIISVSIPCNAQQIVKWNLVTDGSPTPVSSNCSSGWFTSGSGITFSPASGEWANANSWPATSVDTSKYYQVFLAPHKGYKLTISALHFSERRSLTGIRAFQVRWAKSASFTQYDTFPAVTVPDDDAVRAHILDNLNLAASQSDTLFIRWYGYNAESRTGTWRISANSLSIDGNVTSTVPKDADSQILQPSGMQVESAHISSLADTQQLAQPVFRFSIRDAGTSDTLPTCVTRITLKPGKENTADWPKNIQGLKILAGDTIQTGKVVISSGQIVIPVPSANLVIPNGQSKDITVLVYLNKSGLEDGKVLQFQVDSVNHGFDVSDTASTFSQSFPQTLVSGTFPIEVKATRMVFSSLPLSVIENIDFSVCIHLCDANGNTDVHSGRQLIIEKYNGNGILSSIDSMTRHAVSGECTWNHLKYKGSGTLGIKILAAGLKDSILLSNDISVIDPPASISDDFENGKLSEWLNTDEWECSDVEPISGKLSLKHSASVDPLATKDTSYISRKLPLWNWGNLPFCWRITLKNGNFDPSSDNKFGFFLVSDNPDLSGKQLTGYVAGVDLSGTTDKLTLWKMEKGHIVSTLINANFDWNASDTVALEVTRSSQGLWTLRYNNFGDFQKLVTAGSMSDTSFKSNGYCGLLYTFTPSRAGQLWADDFYAGLPVLDTIPPKLIELKVLNKTTLELRFSECISNQSAVNAGNYLINGSIQPAVVKPDTSDASLILLCFDKPFEKNLVHTLIISHLSDQNGNIIKDLTNQMFSYCPFEALEARPLSENHLVVSFSQLPDAKNVLLKSCYLLKETGNIPDSVWIDKEIPARIHLKFNVGFIQENQYSLYVHGLYNSNKDTLEPAVLTFFWYKPRPYDVVINEIMADPEPSAGLPQAEYMELYNRTKYSINLSGWAIDIGAQSMSFQDVAIAANGYLILCRDTSVFNQYGQCSGLFTSSVQLPNSSGNIILKDSQGQSISSVTYSDQWYGGSYKQDGGWSLEMVDVNNPCGEEENWKVSENPAGGTPGKGNSVASSNPDIKAPELLRVTVPSDSTLRLFFNESIFEQSFRNPDYFFVDHGINNPVLVQSCPDDKHSLLLTFPLKFLMGTDYLLTLTNGITDCVGNPLSDKNYAHFALPQSPDSLDILINEILFNPFPDGTDFVEIYNHSSKVIDLADLSICTRDITSGQIKNCSVIAKEGRLIFPGEYVVITADRLKVQNHYLTPNDNCFSEVAAMPAINDEEGTVMLINRKAQMIDFFSYNKNMHFGLISNTEGVSLERINFDQSTNNASNWHSAAETVGYATPGYKNSQYNAQIDRSSEFSVLPEIFSPDNDGRDDLLHIHYKLDQPGFVANIMIFDSRGREVKRLGRNVLLSSEGDMTWDGLDHTGGKASMGMYILFVELFNLNGEVRNIKKSFVLSEKL